MKILKAISIVLFILVALSFSGITAFYAWKIASAVIAGAKTLEPTVYVPLAVTIFTAFLGLTATLTAQAKNRKREIEAAFRERKIVIYLDFLETFERLLLSKNPLLNLSPIDESELAIKLIKFRTKAVLWGSPEVLKALDKFSKIGEGNPIDMMRALENLQIEMRKDLGLSNFGLEKDFFSRLILKDQSEFDAFVKSRK